MYERLTAISPKNGMAYLVNVKPDEQDVESSYPNTLRCIMDSFNRLAAYEDSGLSPEDCAAYAKEKAEKESVEYYVHATNEAAKNIIDLLEAKSEGRLVVLPCKAGDTVYATRKSDLVKCTVQWVTIDNGITIAVSYECDYECKGCPFNHPYENPEAGDGGCDGEIGFGIIELSAIGKTVFLTREAAEKALVKP